VANLTASDGAQGTPSATQEWEALYQERLNWWSLQPLAKPDPPQVEGSGWASNEVDRFILAQLEKQGLNPVPRADPRTLARRLSFALTGLPPDPEAVRQLAENNSAEAYEDLVDSLLASPHFGERWARHWMDVVHYADTHGYEWDVPASGAWRYRDYLIRAFNQDLSIDQMIREQIAGDLLPPRIDPETGINESLIGPCAMRLGERRHGDNADAEGISQEMVDNVIDTLSKGYIATTVACAHCHDHKLDAVEQKDYYALAGVLMSTRWVVRSLETRDPNLTVIAELRDIKRTIRQDIETLWLASESLVSENIRATLAGSPSTQETKKKTSKGTEPPPEFPDSFPALWRHVIAEAARGATMEAVWRDLKEDFTSLRKERMASNKRNLQLIADFTGEQVPQGWYLDGFGLKHGLVQNGEIVISEATDCLVGEILPAGRWTHVWSQRLGGAIRSPLFAQDSPPTVSVEYGGGKFGAHSLIVDNCFHSERMQFFREPKQGWLTVETGNLRALAGTPDTKPRRAYLELVTKSFNNYFPPRVRYGGSSEEEERDPRSWVGISRVFQHSQGQPPADELGRFAPLFADEALPSGTEEIASRLARVIHEAVKRWSEACCDREDVRLLNETLAASWLPNESTRQPHLTDLAMRYREVEKKIQPDRTIGTVADWNEGGDERVGVRGSYEVLAEEVPRGNIRFLGGPGVRSFEDSSGRLELALNFASQANPLTARVFVNRVWHHLFGAGLVRTVDDFGQLGDTPSHPELLDWLANRFMREGWSLKKLVRLLVTTSTWRQSSVPDPLAVEIDPDNRLWHHHPMQRLDAESIRDAILAASGGLDPEFFGEPIEPYRVAEDPEKRLFCGPLDGEGRRSLYLEMTLMEPPKFLALFNQPMPKLTQGARDRTSVPNQALALLNDPFVKAMAENWGRRALLDGANQPEERVGTMFETAFARPPKDRERARLVHFAEKSANLRGLDSQDLMGCETVWQDVAHAIFNLKEFIYIQ
jgi:hypothetical protein